MRILPFFILFSTFLFGNLTETGVKLLASGKNDEAYKILEESFIKTKDKKALYYMGFLNMVELNNYSAGVRQIKESANLGYLQAQFELANILYKSGRYKKAKNWLKKAAKKNHPKSIYLLGYMYEMGVGTPKNMAKARYWYKKIGMD